MKFQKFVAILLLIAVSVFSLAGCYYDQDDLDAAQQQGYDEGHDDGYYDGYKDALVEYGIIDPPANKTETFDPYVEEDKSVTLGDIVSYIFLGIVAFFMLITLCPFVKGFFSLISSRIEKKKNRGDPNTFWD